jgi:hypothetical protein
VGSFGLDGRVFGTCDNDTELSGCLNARNFVTTMTLSVGFSWAPALPGAG